MAKNEPIDLNLMLECIDSETGITFPVTRHYTLLNQDGSFVALWLMRAPVFEKPNADIVYREFANVFDKYGNPLSEDIDFVIRNV